MNNSDSEIPQSTSPTRTKATYKLICVSKVKKFALEYAKVNRAQKFSRVGEDFLIACEANLKTFIQGRVGSHPSKGKTLT
jgi:hypothetical protein